MGYVHVYTGDGKGKSTAAFGLAFRALGHDKRVALLQFMKSSSSCGEIRMAERLDVLVHHCGLDHWVVKGEVSEEDRQAALGGLRQAEMTVSSNEFDIVILDELATALYFELVPVQAVLALLKRAGPKVELVITGRGAPQELVDAADLVTEMTCVKHYYEAGVKARAGIEY